MVNHIKLEVQWWASLTNDWKQAFGETFFKHHNKPSQQELDQLFAAPVLRMAGPRAAFPNLSFELNDISGIAHLTNLEILIVSYHRVQTIAEVSHLGKLKCLFLNNNNIASLAGVENLLLLKQLYVQHNQIESLLPVQNLIRLKELYVHDNRIASLQGLTEAHSDQLEGFFCKPNALLKQKEWMRVESELYIKCRSV